MQMERVIVRAYGNEALIRYVSKIGLTLVYITNDPEQEPIGFPKEDVFKYDQVAQKACKGSKYDWGKLKPLISSGSGVI